MTEHEYRTLTRAYANSDLSELAGQKMKASPETLAFGTAFHTLILEPEKLIGGDLTTGQIDLLAAMTDSFFSHTVAAIQIAASQKEVIRTWTDEATGLSCKAKIDAIVMPKQQHLIDLKTTSCATHQRFLDSCYDYEYYRQAAFYLSSDPKAQFFSFIGVQKVAPYNLYKLDFHRSSDFVQRGMKRVGYLLNMAKESGFVPSSWSRKEVISE